MKKKFNYTLFFLVVFLASFGILFFACLSAPLSFERFGDINYYFFHQILFGFLPAIFLGYIVYKIPVNFLKKWAPLLVFLNIIALFLVFLPKIGIKMGGANRWMAIGDLSIQPSEFLKITSILYLSTWIASKLSEKNVSTLKSFVKRFWENIIYIFAPFTILLGLIFIALYLQRDAGTMGIITLTLLAIYFCSKTPLWHTLAVIFTGAGLLLFMIIFEPYRFNRWLIFLNPTADPLGTGFQLRQSLISLGSGGIFGKGLGMSVQKFGLLPQPITDSIFAVIGEELGILGCVVLISAFVWFFWLGIKIVKNSNDGFAKNVALGIVFWITLQAFINISSVIGILPLTGIPLPFFSYGGSHLMAELISIGLLLNISKNT